MFQKNLEIYSYNIFVIIIILIIMFMVILICYLIKDAPKNDKVNFAHLMSFRESEEEKVTVIFTHAADLKLAPDIIL